jgi:hypothetical protein
MTKMSIKKALSDPDGLLEKRLVKNERIALIRGGKTVAVVVSVEDFNKLRAMEREEHEDVRDAKTELRNWKRGGKTIPWEQIKQENGL